MNCLLLLLQQWVHSIHQLLQLTTSFNHMSHEKVFWINVLSGSKFLKYFISFNYLCKNMTSQHITHLTLQRPRLLNSQINVSTCIAFTPFPRNQVPALLVFPPKQASQSHESLEYVEKIWHLAKHSQRWINPNAQE